MVFSQLQFLFYFLPIVLLLVWLAPPRWRNAVLVAASLVFYAWGASDAIALLVLSIAVNYSFGRWLAPPADRPRAASIALAAAAIGFNLALLGYYKYAAFFATQANALFGYAGLPAATAVPAVALPVGISFYTFHSLSYLIDVRRGLSQPFRNPLDYALYVAFFPQLVAGPIVRFHQIAPQIRARMANAEGVAIGAVRFCFGLAKKVLIADPIGEIAQAAFALPAADLTAASVWLGVVAYAFQLYFDFSAYSDMAIGLARIFGFEFPENFLRPYSALSISDFWRRWHITLSGWFRDYVYLPLGRGRGPAAGYAVLVAVFLLTGLWHGANWTFVAWGAYHGALLAIERATGVASAGHVVRFAPVRQALTFLLLLLGWVLFRADNLAHAGALYGAMVGPAWTLAPGVAAAVTSRNLVTLAVAAVSLFLPRRFATGVWLSQAQGPTLVVARAALMLVVVPLLVLSVVSSGFHPFLYFRF